MNIDIVRIEMVRDRSIEYGKDRIKKPGDIADLGYHLFDKIDREMFVSVCLNSDLHINAVHVVSVGCLDATLVHPREVFKPAILSNSVSMIVMHNHPSGNVDPSKADVELTNRLIGAGKLLQIPLFDHVIIGEGEFYSFLDNKTCEFFKEDSDE